MSNGSQRWQVQAAGSALSAHAEDSQVRDSAPRAAQAYNAGETIGRDGTGRDTVVTDNGQNIVCIDVFECACACVSDLFLIVVQSVLFA